jgi:hypothetical protein
MCRGCGLDLTQPEMSTHIEFECVCRELDVYKRAERTLAILRNLVTIDQCPIADADGGRCPCETDNPCWGCMIAWAETEAAIEGGANDAR